MRSQGRSAVETVRARVEESAEEAIEEMNDPTRAPRRSHDIFRVRQELLDAQRRALLEVRDEGEVDDEVIREVLHWLDLEEAALVTARPDED